jgi:hypothetical protein
MADEVKPLAISQTAVTISCTASGVMRTPSESPDTYSTPIQAAAFRSGLMSGSRTQVGATG